MTFDDLMIYRGLSESSMAKYLDAIQGSLSHWAMEGAGLLGHGLSNYFETHR